MIERQMQKDGHRTWGYVIYRTTYSSDDDWAEFLRHLHFHMENVFDIYNDQDILEQFTLTAFSDSSLFDGADTPMIRAHFAPSSSPKMVPASKRYAWALPRGTSSARR